MRPVGFFKVATPVDLCFDALYKLHRCVLALLGFPIVLVKDSPFHGVKLLFGHFDIANVTLNGFAS